jgi:hypothetical protein
MGNRQALLFPWAISYASNMELMLKVLYKHVEVKVFAAKLTRRPISVIFDMIGSYKLLIAYKPLYEESGIDKYRMKVVSSSDITRLNTMLLEINNLYVSNMDTNQTLHIVDDCLVCMDNKVEIVLPCLHSFCQQCYDDWKSVNPTCPFCRVDMTSSNENWQLETVDETDLRRVFLALCRNVDIFLSSLDDMTDELYDTHKVVHEVYEEALHPRVGTGTGEGQGQGQGLGGHMEEVRISPPEDRPMPSECAVANNRI